MNTSSNKSEFLKKLLEQIDPVSWLKANTGFDAWPYEAKLLRESSIRTRVIRKSRQIGITTTIAHEAIWKTSTSPNKVILIVSPSDRQSKIVMGRIQIVVDKSQNLHRRVARKNRSELEFDNKSVILSLPNNPDRLRGFSATDIYLDEAAHFLNDDPVMRAIQPMVVATRGTFTIISTPFGKRGLFWERYKHAVNQQTIDPEVKAYDLFPSSISPLIGEEGFERERSSGAYNDLEFRQEFLGEFLEEVDVYLTLDLIMACVNNELEPLTKSQPNHHFYWGVDFAKKRDETAVIILEKIKRPDGSTKLIVRQWFTWARMDYSDQIGRLGQLRQHLPCAKGFADQTGVGEAIIEDVTRAIPNCEGKLFTQASKLDMLGRVRVWMESTLKKKQDPNLRLNELEIPNDKKLIMQLNSIQYEVSKAGNIIFKDEGKERIHDDYPWALALAVSAANEPEMVVQDLFRDL